MVTTGYELTHLEKKVAGLKNQITIIFFTIWPRRKNPITFIFIKMMSHDLLVQPSFRCPKLWKMNFQQSFFSWEFVAISCRASLFDAQSQSCSFVVSVCFIHKIFTMMSFYHCYKNSTFVYLSHWNVQWINPIDIKTIKKALSWHESTFETKTQTEKIYTFLRKKAN